MTVTVTQKIYPSGVVYPVCKDIFKAGNKVVASPTAHQVNCMITRNLLTVIPLIRCVDGSYLGSVIDSGFNGYFISGKKYVNVKGKISKDKTYGKVYWKCLGK